MPTPVSQAQVLRVAADRVLSNGEGKTPWVKLATSELPADGQQLALDAMLAECQARRAMDAFKSWAAEKANVPAGMRRVYGLERGVTDPNMMADILYKDVAGNAGNTVRGSWSSFTGTPR